MQKNYWWLYAALTLPALPARAQQGDGVATPARVVVTGTQTDTEARRDFVAGKIVISRKRIEDSGAAHVDELLKREPAISVSGDGRIGLLGLPGYTQVLVDGAPPEGGRGIAQLKLANVEKIEIVKSAVAEYGPFGIAGTINVVTRKVQRTTNSRLGVSTGESAGQPKAGISLAHDDSTAGAPLRFGVTLDANQTRSATKSQLSLVQRQPDRVVWEGAATSRGRNNDVTVTTEVSWDGGGGHRLRLAPNAGRIVNHDAVSEQRSYRNGGATDARIASRTEFSMATLPLTWTVKPTSKSELEVRAHATRLAMDTAERRLDRSEAGASARDMARDALSHVRALDLKYKARINKAHDIKFGARLLHTREAVHFTNRIDGGPDAAFDFVGAVRHALNRQTRIFAQDDWRISDSLAVNAGLSGQLTVIDLDEGSYDSQTEFRLWSPSVHIVKDFGKHDDTRQVRLSLAQSNRAPDQDDLALRPAIHPLAPCAVAACGANTLDTFDSAGNPGLRPERALGLNLAYEYGIGSDSTLTVEAYARRIRGKIGTQIAEEAVAWSSVPRYVSRPANLGDAWAQGLNLEMELALRDLARTAPRLYLRGAINLASSRVESLPGPDNRLDKQTPWSAKLGASYQLPKRPLKFDLDASWSPGVWVRSNHSQRIAIDRRMALSAGIGWTIGADRRLQLSFADWLPRTTHSIHEYEGRDGIRDLTTRTRKQRSFSLRFDTKL